MLYGVLKFYCLEVATDCLGGGLDWSFYLITCSVNFVLGLFIIGLIIFG